MDQRLTPANDRVAAASLRGRIKDVTFVTGQLYRIAAPVVDLLRMPNGNRDRQLVMGQQVSVYEDRDGWAFVQVDHDNYVGYIATGNLIPTYTVTHKVIARSTHLYTKADFKSPDLGSLSFGSELEILQQVGNFGETKAGFVPLRHIWPIAQMANDPVSIAEKFLGTPYLWGGNSGFGLDCSGLVQAACLLCGIPCPGDSDLQQDVLGTHLDKDTPLKRNDLLFWKGHVAWVQDENTLLHANACHMATQREPLQAAVKRIQDQGDGPITARKRLEVS